MGLVYDAANYYDAAINQSSDVKPEVVRGRIRVQSFLCKQLEQGSVCARMEIREFLISY